MTEYEAAIALTWNSTVDGGSPGEFRSRSAVPLKGVTDIWLTKVAFAGVAVTSSVPDNPYITLFMPDVTSAFTVGGKIAGGIPVPLTAETTVQDFGGEHGMLLYSSRGVSLKNKELSNMTVQLAWPNARLLQTGDLTNVVIWLRVRYTPENTGRIIADRGLFQ